MKFIFASVFFLSAFAFAGTETSGGGASVVCRDSNKQIISAELLDLYEGKIRYNFRIEKSNVNPKQQILNALARVAQHEIFVDQLKKVIIDTTRRIQFLPEGLVIAPPNDLGNDFGVVIPDGCALEAVGYYESNGVLKVSKTLYNRLTNTDKAAFILHEAIYRIQRTGQVQNSAWSRHMTSQLFARNLTDAEVFAFLTSDSAYPIFDEDGKYGDLYVQPVRVSGPSYETPIRFEFQGPSQALIGASVACTNFRYVPFSGGTIKAEKRKGQTSLTTQDMGDCPIMFTLAYFDGSGKKTIRIIEGGKLIFSGTYSNRVDSIHLHFVHPDLVLPELP